MIHSKGKIVGAEYGSAVLKGCSVFTVQSINIQFTVMLCDTKQILDVGVGADIFEQCTEVKKTPLEIPCALWILLEAYCRCSPPRPHSPLYFPSLHAPCRAHTGTLQRAEGREEKKQRGEVLIF